MDYKTYALMAILLASVATVALGSAAFAQTTTLTVETDAESYAAGDTITVTGQLDATPIDRPLLIQVFDPQNNRVRLDQFDAAANGSYSYTFGTGGTMKTDGTYTVLMTYKGTEAETTFEFDAAEGEGPAAGWKEIDAMIGGEAHTIEYKITGGRLVSITGDGVTPEITVTLATTAAGTLTLRFDEEIFDAEDMFVAIADEVPTDDEYPAGPGATNEISIDFEQGTEEIVIVGDSIIPEFGAIAAIVLAVAIVGIIVATARYGKFNFTPRL